MNPLPTRRSFLATAAAAAATAPFARALPHRPPSRHGKQKILVLGGTQFLGPAVVRAALAKGHELTLFNRGKTNPGLFPEVEKIHGQRRRQRADGKGQPQDLKALMDRKWDAVVDTSAYFTGEVEDVCKILQPNTRQYLFVSSLSVYQSLEKDAKPVDEQSPLCECRDKYTQDLGKEYENYGALKRYCEDAALAAYGKGATIVRPGYIVGPDDPTDRFTYWPARFQRGGECLAPGTPDNDLQFVDVRDLGEWFVHLIEGGIGGVFNAVGFAQPLTVKQFLDAGNATVGGKCSFTWVDDAFLEANKVTAWDEMGCWTPKAKNGHSSNQKMIAAGATFRPIADTIKDTAAWAATRGDKYQWRAGMKAEREQELLAKWKAGKTAEPAKK